MVPHPTCSLLISTYNWPESLRLCLLSVLKQTILPNEIIICDDGSREDTRRIVEQIRPLSTIPLIHVWHPDEGFQLAQIRNKGIARASANYILQIDGDIILHRHYVRDQLNNARPGFFFSGNRYYLSPEKTTSLLTDPKARIGFSLEKNSWRRLWLPFLQGPMRRYYHWQDEYMYTLGCNMAFWRQDLLDVNGYDESFRGWGSEDTDLALRLMNRGIRLQFIRFGGIQYHLYHPEASRDQLTDNHIRAMQAKQQGLIRCERGIDQYM